ncbi:hypothetical protein OESDEN_07332 [Oesophagostomum dentatum]|uniref:Uncharacterized protein n=1 Tax=Oesophagostomum dentatum TaxID=61180 RepID=A0A0B1T5D6_OESDE|nr:hypothetical protein OESDEN_07332 [Oesophagostomum dentatum]
MIDTHGPTCEQEACLERLTPRRVLALAPTLGCCSRRVACLKEDIALCIRCVRCNCECRPISSRAVIDAALARVTALEGTTTEGTVGDSDAVEVPSTSKDRTKNEGASETKRNCAILAKKSKGEDPASVLDSVETSTIDELESALLGIPSSPLAQSKAKKSRSKKAKKSKAADATAAIASLDQSPVKGG